MPSDPGNMPFQRVRPDDEPSADDALALPLPQTLRAESILLQEFNHANVAAYQAKEERARTFNLYLVGLGIIISAIVTLETVYVIHPIHALTIVGIVACLVATLGSLAYFARLFVLGSIILDSTTSMNVIKEFYIQQLRRQIPQLEQAFHWRLADTNTEQQSGRMPFVMRLIVALSGSVFCGFAVDLALAFQEELALPAGKAFVQTTPTDVIVIALAFILSLTAFVILNTALTHRYNPARVLQAEAGKLGLIVPIAKRRGEENS